MHEMNPVQWAILPLKKYATFSGRAPRAEYWWFYLMTVVIGIPARLLDESLADHRAITTIIDLILLLPWLGVTVRRLHDTNRSGWLLLAFFGALVIFALATGFAVAAEASDSNATTITGLAAALLLLLVTVGIFLVFMVQRGTHGPNPYGPDPYGISDLEEVFA